MPSGSLPRSPISRWGRPPNRSLIDPVNPAIPQFTSINYIWAPLGTTWYDSVQAKVTKRFSHNFGLHLQLYFPERADKGCGNVLQPLCTIAPQINDVYNRTSINTFPASPAVYERHCGKLHDSQGFLLEQNGEPVTGGLADQHRIAFHQRAAHTRSGGFQQRRNSPCAGRRHFRKHSAGAELYVDQNGKPVDINGDFDPAATFVLNKDAWTEPPVATFSTSTAYYNNYRGRRHPTENVSLARNIRFGSDGKYNLQLRAEFSNIFNRLWVPDPTSTSASATRTTTLQASQPADLDI